MKLWSKILFALLLLTGVVYATSLFFDTKLQSSHSIHFDATAENIFEQLNCPQNWKQWSPWLTDSLLNITYTKKKVGKNAGFQWTGASGSGSFIITDCRQNRQLSSTIEMDGWNTIYSDILLTPDDQGTTFEWTLTTYPENPIDRIMGYFYKGWMLRDIRRSLKKMHRHLFLLGKTKGEIISIEEVNMLDDSVSALMLYDTLSSFPDRNISESYFNKFREEMKKWDLKQHHTPFVCVIDTLENQQFLTAFGMGIQDISAYKGDYAINVFKSHFITGRFVGPSKQFHSVADSLRKISDKKGFKTYPQMYVTFADDTITKGLYTGVAPVSVTLMKENPQ
jgi:hypothetical protein